MKLTKSILMAGAVAFAMVSVANADVTVRITGSTAARKFVNQAIMANLGSCKCAVQNGGPNVDQFDNVMAIYKGTFNSTNYIIKTSFTGSEAGIQTVDQSLNVAYLPDTTTATVSVAPGDSSNTSVILGSAATTVNEVPDIAFSDTKQATSQFASGAVVSGTTYTTLTDSGNLAVLPFVFVASKNARTLLTGSSTGTPNISTQEVKALYAAGKLPVAFFTGNTTDHTNWIYALGRNPDSGTRLTTFAEVGMGATTLVKQYAPSTSLTDTGTNNLISGACSTSGTLRLNLWPTETINGVKATSPNSGYNSGPDLGYALGSADDHVAISSSTPTTANTVGMIGYVSTGDAANATTSTGAAGVICTFNGVKETTAAVQEGVYTLWTYEHMFYRSNADTTNPGTTVLASALATSIPTASKNSIPVSTMHVSRTVEGGSISKGY